jgi:hypothetical protein
VQHEGKLLKLIKMQSYTKFIWKGIWKNDASTWTEKLKKDVGVLNSDKHKGIFYVTPQEF